MLALLPDIHANRQALEAVLADAVSRGATRFAALGDIVGFGADAAWCAQRLRNLRATALRGNHEAALLHPELFATLPTVQRMTEQTAHQLSPELMEWLSTLPFTEEVEGIPLTHATFHAPEQWGRLSKPTQATRSFAAQQAPLAFFGHTHRPTLFCQNKGQTEEQAIPYNKEGSFVLHPEAGKRYLVNPGSVGQPRDGDPRAAYALWDGEALTLRRVAYDSEAAAECMLRAGWPKNIAEKLRCGLSPL